MKKRTYLYIPLILLFILSMSALVQHGNRTFLMLSRTINQSGAIRAPFEIQNGRVLYVLPEASEAGIQVGDAVTAINGMLEELKNVYDNSSEEILTHIVACADKFADGAKQHDDMTMIIVKII